MPTNAISYPSKNLCISNLLLCSMLCAQAQSQMQFTIYCSPVFLLLCSQGLLTNSTVGNIPCSKEGVQAGREFPIPHCQVWHQGSTAPSLPTLPLSVILSFFNTHTGPDLFHFAAPTPATLPAQDTAFSSPTPPTSPSPRQGYTTLHGPGTACHFHARLLPATGLAPGGSAP